MLLLPRRTHWDRVARVGVTLELQGGVSTSSSEEFTMDVQRPKYSCAQHTSLGIGQLGALDSKERRTIEIRECPIILVFYQHVAKLDLRAVHVLSDDEQLRDSPPLDSPAGDDIPDLYGQRFVQFWEGRLRKRKAFENPGQTVGNDNLTILGSTLLISSTPNKSISTCGDTLFPTQIIITSALSENE